MNIIGELSALSIKYKDTKDPLTIMFFTIINFTLALYYAGFTRELALIAKFMYFYMDIIKSEIFGDKLPEAMKRMKETDLDIKDVENSKPPEGMHPWN